MYAAEGDFFFRKTKLK